MSYCRSRGYADPVPKMPPGLIELMEGLSKDVLRSNPTNVYEFCANHMEKLLQIRDVKQRKNVVCLQKKITKAQEIIRQRAKQRRENYDKIIHQEYLEANNFNIKTKAVEAKQFQHDTLLAEILTVDSNHISSVSNEAGINSANSAIFSLGATSVTKELADYKLLINNVNDFKVSELKETSDSDKLENNELSSQEDVKSELNMTVDITDNKLDTVTPIENVEAIEIIIANNNNSENTITDDIEQNSILGTENINEDIGSTHEITKAEIKIQEEKALLGQHAQSFIKGEEGESVLKIIDNVNFEDDKLCAEDNYGSMQSEFCDHTVDGISDERKSKDLDNNSNNEVTQHNMDLETAAITIQKVFRTFLFKSRTNSIDDATNVDINLFIDDKDLKDCNSSNMNNNKERRGVSRMDTILQTVNEEKSLSLSTDDSSTLSSAATIIQAHIRGFLVRNKLNINKSLSSNSFLDSDGLSGASLENDNDEQQTKTVLNIHIVPERGHFTNRDESLMNSMDTSPRSVFNLHPHSYDASERRKQLKREDAVQSVSPPSNNSSSKLSEDVDSLRVIFTMDNRNDATKNIATLDHSPIMDNESNSDSNEIHTAVQKEDISPEQSHEKPNVTSDELDVITPFIDNKCFVESDKVTLKHSGEFHEVVLPTKVSRSDTSIVREFHNVLAYFLLWD